MDNPAAGAGSELGAAARRIPPVGWAGIIGAGVVIGLYMRHRNSQAATPTAPVTDPVPAHGSTQLTPLGASPPAAIQAAPKVTTNRAWLNESLTFLIANGVDAGTASTALHAFINGDTMDVAGSAAVKMAIAEFGEPPEGIPPPHFTAPPTSPVPSSPPPVRQPPPPAPPAPPAPPPPAGLGVDLYTVQRGDSLSGIAAKYHGLPYGHNVTWQKIWEHNRSIIGSNPNLIQPGWELGIPLD